MNDVSAHEIGFNSVNFENKIYPSITGGFKGLLAQFSEHVNSLSFKNGKEVKREGDSITMPNNSTLDELKELNGKLGVSDVSRIGDRLQDVAVLLANEKTLPENLQPFINYLYQLGDNINQNGKDNGKNNKPLTFEELKTTSLHLPENADKEAYEKEIWLYMLGKYDRQVEFPDIDKDQKQSRHYYDLYSRWKKRRLESPKISDSILKPEEENQLRQEFDDLIWKKRELIKSIVFDSIQNKGQVSDKTTQALQELTKTALTQTATFGIVEHGLEEVRTMMKLPPSDRLSKQLDPTLYSELLKLFPNIDQNTTKLYEAVEKSLKQRQEQQPNLSNLEKAQIIWDIVQAYNYAETYSLRKAVDTLEFECQLRSIIGADILRTYLPDINVAAIYSNSHIFLGIEIDKELYQFDANRTREKNWDSESSFGIDMEDWEEIKPIIKKYFQTGLPQVFSSEYVTTGYASIDNPEKALQAGLLANIAYKFAFDKKVTIELYRLALKINPSDADAWNNLGNVLVDREEKISCYKKALEINPRYAYALYNIADATPDDTPENIQEKLGYYERFLKVLPIYPEFKDDKKYVDKEIKRLKTKLLTHKITSPSRRSF